MSLLAFLVAVAYVPGVPSATLVGRWWVVAIGAAVLLYRTPRLTLTPAHWVGAALLAWCALGLLWSYSRWDTLGGLAHLLALAGVFCVAAEEEHSSGGALSAPMALFGLGLVPSAAVAVGQQLGWQPVLNISDHPVGLFLSKNAATEAAVPVLVWLLVGLGCVGGRPRKQSGGLSVNSLRPLYWLTPPVALMTVLPQAKETWLMLAGAVLTLVLVWARARDRRDYGGTRHRTAGVLAVAGGLAVLAAVVAASQPEEATHSLNERLAIWQATLDAWQIRPWGWGLGTYQHLLFEFEYAHDDYFQMLFETGPVGLALVVALFVLVLGARGDGGGVRGLVAEKAALASLLASALVWWPLQSPASGFLAALLAGGLAGAGARARVAELGGRGAGGEGVRPARGYGAGAVWPAPGSWDHLPHG